MAHLAIVCPPTPSHINPVAVLGRPLMRRGHRVTLFHLPPMRKTAVAEGLDFYPAGAWSGPGEAIAPRAVNVDNLRASIRRIMEHPGFRQRAGQIRDSIGHAASAEKGADVVKAVMRRAKA